MGYFPSPGWSLAVIFSSIANQSQLHFWLLEKMQGVYVCISCQREENIPATGNLPHVPGCRLIIGGKARFCLGWGWGSGVQVSQRLYRLPGRVGRYDPLTDGVSGRAGHFGTPGFPRSGWPGVIQARVHGSIRAHHWVTQFLESSWHPLALSCGNCTCCPWPPGPGVQVVLVSGVWVTIVVAGDMGGAGLCSAHISPSSLLLLKWESRWEVLGEWKA